MLKQLAAPYTRRFPASRKPNEFLNAYDARFVIVTQGPNDDAYESPGRQPDGLVATANSPLPSDMGAPPSGGFQLNIFLRVGTRRAAPTKAGTVVWNTPATRSH